MAILSNFAIAQFRLGKDCPPSFMRMTCRSKLRTSFLTASSTKLAWNWVQLVVINLFHADCCLREEGRGRDNLLRFCISRDCLDLTYLETNLLRNELRMDGRPYESYYSTQNFHNRRNQGPLSRPGTTYFQGFDGEHLALCLVSAVLMYGAGYIIAKLFFSGIIFFLSVGLIVFFVMQIIDSLNSGTKTAGYNKSYY